MKSQSLQPAEKYAEKIAEMVKEIKALQGKVRTIRARIKEAERFQRQAKAEADLLAKDEELANLKRELATLKDTFEVKA